MIINELYNQNPIVIECSCGCGHLIVDKYITENSDYVDYNIVYLKDEFQTRQHGSLNILFKRIKHAWFTLIGKEYYLFDICLTSTQWEEFKKQANKL